MLRDFSLKPKILLDNRSDYCASKEKRKIIKRKEKRIQKLEVYGPQQGTTTEKTITKSTGIPSTGGDATIKRKEGLATPKVSTGLPDT